MLNCNECKKDLSKDEIALSKKLLGLDANKILCLECLADYLDCTIDDLEIKIEEFKEQGCTLFK